MFSRAHAKILKVDATEALKEPGVVDFVCHKVTCILILISKAFSGLNFSIHTYLQTKHTFKVNFTQLLAMFFTKKPCTLAGF
jgi:hypothetical protein